MSYVANWNRWIYASICKHFDDRRGGYAMYVEAAPRETRVLTDFFELRVDGPRITEVAANEFKLYYEINMLTQNTISETDLHTQQRMLGVIAAAFTDIDCYRFGNGPSDDGLWFACLQLIQNERKKERVVVSNFGQVDTSTMLQQGSVEGHYHTLLIGS